MSTANAPISFEEVEEATDLMVVDPTIEDEDTDVIPRRETTDGWYRDASKDGSDFAFLFRLN